MNRFYLGNEGNKVTFNHLNVKSHEWPIIIQIENEFGFIYIIDDITPVQGCLAVRSILNNKILKSPQNNNWWYFSWFKLL